MQHHNRRHAQPLLARPALRRFALQILQESVRKMIEGTLAPGLFLSLRSAVRTKVFHRVLLRIAVQCSPTRAAYAYRFHILPFHGVDLLRSTSTMDTMSCGVISLQTSYIIYYLYLTKALKPLDSFRNASVLHGCAANRQVNQQLAAQRKRVSTHPQASPAPIGTPD